MLVEDLASFTTIDSPVNSEKDTVSFLARGCFLLTTRQNGSVHNCS